MARTPDRRLHAVWRDRIYELPVDQSGSPANTNAAQKCGAA
jgi:hypothetical protein